MASGTEWFIDGKALRSGVVRDVESVEGWHNLSPFVGDNVSIPNRSGQVFVPKTLGTGVVTLNLWLYGASETQLEAAWDSLMGVVSRPYRTMVLQQRRANGEVRVADVELVGGVKPTAIGSRGMRAALTFSILAGYWESQDSFTHATTAGAGLPTTLALPDLAASTAPMENALIKWTGPVTNPRIGWTNAQFGNQSWAWYSGNVPSGAVLSLDSRTWAVSGSGFTPNQAAVHFTEGRFLVIEAGTPLTVQGTSPGSTTKVSITSKRAYAA